MRIADLSPPALEAAMNGGMSGWGQVASAVDHVRYAEPWPKEQRKWRRMCRCGCRKKSTHTGRAKGIALTQGCELSIARWVKTCMFPSMQRKNFTPPILKKQDETSV